jgi:hypothetical protein
MRDMKDIIQTTSVDRVAVSVMQQLATTGTPKSEEQSPFHEALISFAETFFGEGEHAPDMKAIPTQLQSVAPPAMTTAAVIDKILNIYNYVLKNAIIDAVDRETTSAERIRNMFVNTGVEHATQKPVEAPKTPQDARNEPKEAWEQGVDKFVAYLQFARDNHVDNKAGKKAIDSAIADIQKKAGIRKNKVIK